MEKISSAQTLRIHMGDPIFSPDGEFMWTGSEWIPAPPGKENRETNVDVVQSQKQEAIRSKSYEDPPRYDHKIESSSVVIGVIVLVIVAYSYSRYQNSICGSFLSPLAGDDCSLWNTANALFGLMGGLVVVLGLIGKKVASNPKQAILYELQFGRLSTSDLCKKIGVDADEVRRLTKDLIQEEKVNEIREVRHWYYELKDE